MALWLINNRQLLSPDPWQKPQYYRGLNGMVPTIMDSHDIMDTFVVPKLQSYCFDSQ